MMTPTADLRGALDPAATFEQAFRMTPLDWQRDYLRSIGNVVTLKGRQTGASTAGAALAIHEVVYHAHVNVVIVSPSLKQSTEIAIRSRVGLRNLGVRLVQDSTSMIRLANGSRILSLPGTARSVRGWTARLLVLDEAAYISPETWTAARALVATGGRTLAASTPAAADGDFFDLVSGDDLDWTRLTIPSDSVPTISAAFLAAERRAMGEDEFNREYLCRFAPMGTRLFDPSRLDALFVDEVPVP